MTENTVTQANLLDAPAILVADFAAGVCKDQNGGALNDSVLVTMLADAVAYAIFATHEDLSNAPMLKMTFDEVRAYIEARIEGSMEAVTKLAEDEARVLH